MITGLREHMPAARVVICGSPAERPLAAEIAAARRMAEALAARRAKLF